MVEDQDASFREHLARAYPAGGQPGEVKLRGVGIGPEQDSQLAIIQITQYAIYAISQLLVLALTAAVTVSLVVSIWRLTAHPDRSQLIVAMVVALGSIATGTAAIFVQKQANEARKRWWEVRQHRGAAGSSGDA
ncbi:hypothetical protein [Mycobacterium sp. 050134]|uniref:hypothetical protein n=1 Tax=Mycobacterium sp. 050134 TaxID=3096111 RepID=UPI002EDA1891